MPTKTSSKAAPNTPWWLTDGDEHCPYCGAKYFYELEFRCAECDAPGCVHCKVVHAEGYLICPDCIDASTGNHHHD